MLELHLFDLSKKTGDGWKTTGERDTALLKIGNSIGEMLFENSNPVECDPNESYFAIKTQYFNEDNVVETSITILRNDYFLLNRILGENDSDYQDEGDTVDVYFFNYEMSLHVMYRTNSETDDEHFYKYCPDAATIRNDKLENLIECYENNTLIFIYK